MASQTAPSQSPLPESISADTDAPLVDFQPSPSMQGVEPWKPLSGPRHFRILQIFPGEVDTRLECELWEGDLDDFPLDGKAKFEALSYAWGDPTPRNTITCSGKNIIIADSLYAALQNFRLNKDYRWLWADAICIDQDNMEEKNVQEVILAVDCTCYVGKLHVKFYHLNRLFQALFAYATHEYATNQAPYHEYGVHRLPGACIPESHLSNNKLPRRDLCAFRHNLKSKCTDIRDHVYGIVGLFDAPEKYNIDYSLTFDQDPENSVFTKAKPSWAPHFQNNFRDAGMINPAVNDPPYHTNTNAAGAVANVEDIDDHSIRLQGHVVDRIVSLAETRMPGHDTRAGKKIVSEAVLSWESWFLDVLHDVTSELLAELFMDTILQGSWWVFDYGLPTKLKGKITKGADFTTYVVESTDLTTDMRLRLAAPWYERYCNGRFAQHLVPDPEFTPEERDQLADVFARMYTTQKGFIGTGFPNIRVGDMVCLLYGGRVPFVLRPVPDTDKFHLIGETYVHGLMHGEALDMPGLEKRVFTII
ncbi:hypothetical protein H2203_007610 [Taxawa tesnikishii (nom. ined.)]|nr:hypothetical protein H2203_007610 [Dothideales sp. JES 119]